MVGIDGEKLTIEDVVSVARNYEIVTIPQEVRKKVSRSRQVLEDLVKENRIVYGVTTGFGALGSEVIPSEDIRELQTNLIRSHSAGVGEPLGTDVTRALMLLRANTLAKGNSGVKLETLETLVRMINKRVHPVIPEKGSVGASGDLAPLSHMTLVMIGEGEAEYNGKSMSGKRAIKLAGIKPVELDFKEGIALNNGTQMMAAISALAVYDAEKLLRTAQVAAAMSLEALNGIYDAFDEKIHRARPHRGQIETATSIRQLISGSRNIKTSNEMLKEKMKRPPQDPYSLRCIPQILGTVRDAIAYVRKVIEIEINSATDNPLIFTEDKECLSGGNFHGQPISVAMDFLSIAVTTLGNVTERRIARLVDEDLSQGLPAFLVHADMKKGVHSGFMTAQYTAAALASENKTLAHPASVDSIPTSADFEDFVSMGSIAARKAAMILRNVEYIVAIELLCAAQGIDFRGPDKLGKGTRIAYDLLRKHVPMLMEDRVLSKDMETVVRLIHSEQIMRAIEVIWH